MSVRTRTSAVFVALLGVAVGSCVVTYEPQFQNASACPPFFVAQTATPPVNQIDIVSPTDPNPEKQTFTGSVAISSCAIGTFEGRLFFDGQLNNTVQFVPPYNGTNLVPVTITPGTIALTNGCHRIELYASSAFAPFGDPKTPATPGDLAYINWFVDVRTTGAAHTTDDCNQ